MSRDYVTGIVIDERVELSTGDLCRACATSTEWVVELVEEGVLEVRGERSRGSRTEEWRFSGATLSRALRARRLQRDLDLDLPALALVLELMDEIESLRRRLSRGA